MTNNNIWAIARVKDSKTGELEFYKSYGDILYYFGQVGLETAQKKLERINE
jgi:hypothetical protein